MLAGVSPNATMVCHVENVNVHEAHSGPSGVSGDLQIQRSVAN